MTMRNSIIRLTPGAGSSNRFTFRYNYPSGMAAAANMVHSLLVQGEPVKVGIYIKDEDDVMWELVQKDDLVIARDDIEPGLYDRFRKGHEDDARDMMLTLLDAGQETEIRYVPAEAKYGE